MQQLSNGKLNTNHKINDFTNRKNITKISTLITNNEGIHTKQTCRQMGTHEKINYVEIKTI